MTAPSQPAAAGASIRSLLTRMQPIGPVRIEPPRPHAADAVRTARMILRPLDPGDWPAFRHALRVSREHLAHSFPLSVGAESEMETFERHLRLSGFSGPGAPDWRRAAFAPDGRLVGEFNLNAIRRGLEFRAEAAWWVCREFCGRGLATEGVRALLRVAFAEIGQGGLGLHRVDALVCPENAASRRIVHKLGFCMPREAVRVCLDVGGVWREHEMFTRYVEPASQVEAKALPPVMRGRVDAQVGAIERAEPAAVTAAAAVA